MTQSAEIQRPAQSHQERIIVNVPRPEITVVEPHPPWWLEYGVPTATVFLTFLAALFSAFAWRGIKRQIALANRQIEQQDQVIAAALQDLSITKRQSDLADAERARVPRLTISLAYTKSAEALDDQGRALIYLQVYVNNLGKAPANNIEVMVQFADAAVSQAERELIQQLVDNPPKNDIQTYVELSPIVDSFGNRWATVFNRGLELLQGQSPWLIGQGWFYVRAGPTRVLWRAKCRQGDFPGGNLDESIDVLFG